MKRISITPRSFGPAIWDIFRIWICSSITQTGRFGTWIEATWRQSLVPYDRVSAPFKLAFDRAVFESDSQANPNPNPSQSRQPASAAAVTPPRPSAAALSVGIR